jgi:hypothetical protein
MLTLQQSRDLLAEWSNSKPQGAHLAPLTSGVTTYSDALPSKDGKQLFAVAGSRRGELERYDAKSKTFEPYLGGISAQDVEADRPAVASSCRRTL